MTLFKYGTLFKILLNAKMLGAVTARESHGQDVTQVQSHVIQNSHFMQQSVLRAAPVIQLGSVGSVTRGTLTVHKG